MDTGAPSDPNNHNGQTNAVQKSQKSRRKSIPVKIPIQQNENLVQGEAYPNSSAEDTLVTHQLIVCCLCNDNSPPHELEDLSNNPMIRDYVSLRLNRSLLDNESVFLCTRCIAKTMIYEDMRHRLQIRFALPEGYDLNGFLKMQQQKKMEKYKTEEENQAQAPPITAGTNNHNGLMVKIPVTDFINHCGSLHFPASSDAANLSTFDTSGPIDRDEDEQRNSRDYSLTPPPPPYSPLGPSVNVENEFNIITEKPVKQSPSLKVTDIAPQSPKLPYFVEVERITPVKNITADEVSNGTILANKNLATMPPAAHILRSRSDSTHSVNAIDRSMLKIICEHSESALVTESGGKINNYQRPPRAVIQMVCPHCSRIYTRKDHYNKHVRRCQAQRRWNSLPLNKTMPPENLEVVRVNGADENAINDEVPQRVLRVFHCNECPVTLENITQLRRHKQLHFQQYSCETCDSKFTTLHDHEFHRVICLAKQEVQKERELEKVNEQLQKDVDKPIYAKSTVSRKTRSVVTTTTVGRRVTRAQSRAQSRVASTPAKKRGARIASSVSQYTSFCTNDDEENGKNGYSKECNNNDEDEDDAVSVADSMYSKRRCFTGNWVDTRGSKGIYNLPTIKIDTWKEYDLYLLELLKAQINAKSFYCLDPDCNYFADNLLNLMLHDYINHFKSSWFYCQKCGCVFTSKVFLDYHLDRQNGGRYICYKCNDEFVFQHQLDWHLIQHTKCKNYSCDSCNCEFLTEIKLLQHVQNEHSEEIRNNNICIESMIENVPRIYNEWKSNRRTYQKCIRILEGVQQMPSNRPMQLPGYKPYRRHIGVIEFTNEKNPNCWSWK